MKRRWPSRQEARRIEATVQLLATPTIATYLPDAAVFPVELMALSQNGRLTGKPTSRPSVHTNLCRRRWQRRRTRGSG